MLGLIHTFLNLAAPPLTFFSLLFLSYHRFISSGRPSSPVPPPVSASTWLMNVILICADVSQAEDCKRLVDQTINHFGRLDHLVNNAEITTWSMLEDVTDITNFRAVMDTNFWGSVYTTHFAAPHLRKQQR
ncbi:hypothetical protein M0R45_023821 [Rubus argutus]|uniref:Uncharacterized protein n=1 Tax=Rubus argutus TaxID=59490 RepID=A0AAW1WRF5_RUBAR